MNSALDRLAQLPLGTRMVVRHRIDGGLTDALGDLTARDDQGCTISTRTGPVRIKYDDVQLAKAVPPPPPRR
ncbi:MAG: putative acetyltransferase, partial [Specibacter sp.]